MASTIASLVSQNIEKLMADRGMTAAELGRKSGMNHTALYDILKGRSANPRIDTIAKIATTLGVAPWVLMHPPQDNDFSLRLGSALDQLSETDQQRVLRIAEVMAEISEQEQS